MWPVLPETLPDRATPMMWLEAARALRGLAARQVAAIESGGDEMPNILAAKDAAYRRADEIMRRVTADGAPPEPWASDIRAELNALAALEQRSELLLAARLETVRAELRSLRRGQSAAFAYAPSGAAAPRFLDDLR